MTAALTDTERAVLLAPCECGHTINDHGGLVACWRCEDDGDECGDNFEALLCVRVARIVDGRVGAEPKRATGGVLRDLGATNGSNVAGDEHATTEGDA